MKKISIVIIATVALTLVLVLSSIPKDKEESENAYGGAIYSEDNAGDNEGVDSDIEASGDLKKASSSVLERIAKLEKSPEQPEERVILDYSEDWCVYTELTERDRNYAQAELSDWKASTGQYGFNTLKEYGYAGFGNSNVAKPYLEVAKADVQFHIDNKDEMAMFAAIDREDFDLNEKSEIARELLVQGFTGKAIRHLVIHELLLAKISFRSNSDAITDDVRKHLSQALTYAAFSLNRHDASGFVQLIEMFGTVPEFKDTLNPALVLSESEAETAASNATLLAEMVDSERSNRGLPALEDTELSKIAKYELDHSMGRIWGLEPATMQVLNERIGTQLTSLANNDCRARHSELYARR